MNGAAHSSAAKPPPLTKIIATVGPASSDSDTIRKLVEAGVSIFRLNFSHGELDDHASRAKIIRQVAASLGRPVAILGDLQGPKIRVGKIPTGGIEVKVGETVFVTCDVSSAQLTGNAVRLPCNHPALVHDVEPGHRLLVNDGAVRMLIIATRGDEIECSVTAGGLITSGKGINLPDTDLNIEPLSEHDWRHVEWAIRNNLDFLAQSFVRSAEEVSALKDGIARMTERLARPDCCQLRIIAKIETPQAVANIDSIVQVADSIMVARGDLGVEMDLAKVPVIQKKLLHTAAEYGKPCIVATQMLESMINSPIPTRAEASDVAGAIEDGADAVMLSAETAIGKYPLLAVEAIRRIAESTEEYLATLPQIPSPPQKLVESRYRTAALAHGVWTIAQDIAAKFIIIWSQQGGGARYLSQNNFTAPIIAFTSDERSARQMQLLRGVVPLHVPLPQNLADFTRLADEYLLHTGWTERGQGCILVAGAPIGQSGVTNSLAIHELGNPKTGFF